MSVGEEFASKVRDYHRRKVNEIIDRMRVAIQTNGGLKYSIAMCNFEKAMVYAEEFKERGLNVVIKQNQSDWIVRIYFTDREKRKAAKAKFMEAKRQTARKEFMALVTNFAKMIHDVDADSESEDDEIEPEPELKPELKPEPKPEPKPELKTEPKTEPKPEPKLEPKPVSIRPISLIDRLRAAAMEGAAINHE